MAKWSIGKGHIKILKRSVNVDEFPHEVNIILDQFGVKTYKELAKLTCSKKILEKLVNEFWDDPEVCKYVAKNFESSPELLKRLSNHPAKDVRIAVASRTNLDIKTAFKLVFDSCIQVRQALARKSNYKNVKKFLLQMNLSNSKIVSAILLKPENSELILEFINQEKLDVIEAFLENDTLSESYLRAILELQFRKTEYHFIDKIFAHPNFSEEIGRFVIENLAMGLTDAEFQAIKNFVEK
ncbi:MAG: hypothetical protein J6J60_00070 [Clostridia bacterium]|nr:hypothetical protein [Clostridia bacterium]